MFSRHHNDNIEIKIRVDDQEQPRLKVVRNFAISAFLLLALLITSWHNYLLFHTLAEFFSIAIAFSLFIIAWNSRQFVSNTAFVCIGIAYLFIGGLDLIHTISYKGMGVIGETWGSNPATQLWIAARYMESISLLAFVVYFKKTIRVHKILIVYSVITITILISIFYWENFPDCFIQGVGLTSFKKISEYIICGILLAALTMLMRHRSDFDQHMLKLFIASIVLTIFAELAFTFYVSVYGLSNLIGHYFKILSFFLIYTALIRFNLKEPYKILFQNLNSERNLLEKNKALLDATGRIAKVGGWELDLKKQKVFWTHMTGRIHELPDEFVPTLDEAINYYHPDDQKKVTDYVNRAVEEGLPYEFEARLITAKGRHRWVQTIGEPTMEGGKCVRLTGAFQDVTERKKLENQLLQSQKLESVGNLAGGIAHEFNNILSIIIGNNELIMDELPEWSPSRESCEEIQIAGLRARDIVKHLLTFSRQDSSTKKPINIVSVVTESLKLIRSTTPTNIEIRENISAECDPVLGDATQIKQLLINLCSNATDVLPISGGRIDIELCNSDISQDDFDLKIKLPPGKYVRLLVRDNGSGVNKLILDRIFDPYFTTKDIGKGSGIGLAVAHGIVENHGGSIVCDSSKDQGTTFTIMIPVYDGPTEKESGEKDIFFGNGEKILYVDDEPSITKLGKRHLESLGYEAYSTNNPKEALEMIKAEPDQFDLVISDMAMPNMPGDQLIAEILSINPEMPTMICSGYSSRMSETKASEMGIKAFVMKPFDKSELAKKVREVLDSSKPS